LKEQSNEPPFSIILVTAYGSLLPQGRLIELAANTHTSVVSLRIPGLVPAIHALDAQLGKDVDGRDKPGHDGVCLHSPPSVRTVSPLSSPGFDRAIQYAAVSRFDLALHYFSLAPLAGRGSG
jgi:hypothetical protein